MANPNEEIKVTRNNLVEKTSRGETSMTNGRNERRARPRVRVRASSDGDHAKGGTVSRDGLGSDLAARPEGAAAAARSSGARRRGRVGDAQAERGSSVASAQCGRCAVARHGGAGQESTAVRRVSETARARARRTAG
jgi:hypothetical protein